MSHFVHISHPNSHLDLKSFRGFGHFMIQLDWFYKLKIRLNYNLSEQGLISGNTFFYYTFVAEPHCCREIYDLLIYVLY